MLVVNTLDGKLRMATFRYDTKKEQMFPSDSSFPMEGEVKSFCDKYLIKTGYELGDSDSDDTLTINSNNLKKDVRKLMETYSAYYFERPYKYETNFRPGVYMKTARMGKKNYKPYTIVLNHPDNY